MYAKVSPLVLFRLVYRLTINYSFGSLAHVSSRIRFPPYSSTCAW